MKTLAAASAAAEPLGVLLVDDEPGVLGQLLDGLTALGHRVLTATCATEALAILHRHSDIGCLITDIRMPGDDGLSLAQRVIAQQPPEAAIAVVLITGHATIEHATAAVRAGVTDFLRKPFGLQEIGTAVAHALERARARRAESAARHDLLLRAAQAERDRAELERLLGDAQTRLATIPPGSAPALALQRELMAISHALRTPLSAIAGGADMLTFHEDALSTAARGDLALLQTGVRRAIEAVSLVEELHRTDLAPADAPRVPVDLAPVLAQVVASRAAEAAAKGVEMLPVQAGPLVVTGMPDALTRLLELCVEGALDWAPRGTAIRVVGQPLPGGGVEIVFAVRPAAIAAIGHHPIPEGPSQSALSRTQEDLRYSIAERIAIRHAGTLSSSGGAQGMMDLRLRLPTG